MVAVGLMLAGGEGRRMGGVDKGLQIWRGEPMAAHVARAMKAVVPELVISTGHASPLYRELADHLVPDAARFKGQGPLAGLLAGLQLAAELGAHEVLVCPCDTPDVSNELLLRLLAAFQQDHGAPVIAEGGGRTHPLHGVYPVAVAGQLQQQLLAGNRRVYQFALAAGARVVDCNQFADDFANHNFPTDLH